MTDYISREMTIDAICRLCNANFEEDPCEPSECEMMSLLCKIPAADVRPVKWIPVTERLPRDRQFVLVYCGDNKRIRPSDRFDVAILLGDSIFTSLGVTHWMPLPQPPEEG